MDASTEQASELHRRALARIEDPFEAVYEDVEVRSMRTSEIEIIESKMGEEKISLNVYINTAGHDRKAYVWEKTFAGVTTKFHPVNGLRALEILRKHQVLDDLSKI